MFDTFHIFMNLVSFEESLRIGFKMRPNLSKSDGMGFKLWVDVKTFCLWLLIIFYVRNSKRLQKNYLWHYVNKRVHIPNVMHTQSFVIVSWASIINRFLWFWDYFVEIAWNEYSDRHSIGYNAYSYSIDKLQKIAIFQCYKQIDCGFGLSLVCLQNLVRYVLQYQRFGIL